MGMPIRVVISPKSLANNQAEITIRESGEKSFISIDELVEEVKAIIKFQIDEINSTL